MYGSLIDQQKFKIEYLQKMIKKLLKYNESELEIKDAIIAKLNGYNEDLRKTSENIKAVLRIPRLCRQFH